MRRWSICLILSVFISANASAQEPIPGAKKVVFLGDSITHGGQYISYFETELRLSQPRREIEILNLGLPSETVSGLSEDGHAGGKFPRPDLHERLDRVLEKTQPDLIFACYGMNDGIYLPLDGERTKKYRQGLMRLRDKAEKAGIKVIHLTPAVFDTLPIKPRLATAEKADGNHPYEKYDQVLDHYSQWLLERRKDGWKVVDLHFPMRDALAEARKKNPTFKYAGDGVHPNLDGQVTMGRALLRGLDPNFKLDDPVHGAFADSKSKRAELFKLIDQRNRILRDAWLTHTGHKRPMTAGLPLDQAQAKAAPINEAIRMLLK